MTSTATSEAKMSPLRLILRIVRWTTYAATLITLALVLHKSPPPVIETSPQAAKRAEEKLEQVEQAVNNGQPATMRLDQTELNSYLATHLDIASNTAANAAPSTNANAVQAATPSTGTPTATPAGTAPGTPAGSNPEMPALTGSAEEQIQQVQSAVKDVKVELIEDRVRAYVVFNFHGKDMTLQLEGKLGAQDGYLHFEPVAGQIGAFPIPRSTLEAAVSRMMDSPENREKLKLPGEMSGLKIENGEVVATYK
jgi:hypothetical protein